MKTMQKVSYFYKYFDIRYYVIKVNSKSAEKIKPAILNLFEEQKPKK